MTTVSSPTPTYSFMINCPIHSQSGGRCLCESQGLYRLYYPQGWLIMRFSLNPLLYSVFMLQWNREKFMVEWEVSSLPIYFSFKLMSFGTDLQVHAARDLHLTPWPTRPFLWCFVNMNFAPFLFLSNSYVCISLPQCVYSTCPSILVNSAFSSQL